MEVPLQNSVVTYTANVYENAISVFENFRFEYGLARTWPPSFSDFINFLAFLANQNIPLLQQDRTYLA